MRSRPMPMNAMRSSAIGALGEDRARAARGRACAATFSSSGSPSSACVARPVDGAGGRSGARAAGRAGGPRPAGGSARPRRTPRSRGRASSSTGRDRGRAGAGRRSPGVPSRSESRRIQSISFSDAARSSPITPAGASSNTPAPASPQRATHARRARPRRRTCPGTGSPSIARCAIVRDVETPSAPASMPSRTIAGHRRDVVGRSPARCAPRAHPSRSRAPRRAAPACRCRCASGCVSRKSRNSGNVSQPQRMPSDSAAPGMSSTPSMSPMSHSCSVGLRRREADAAVAHDDGRDAVPASTA